MGDIGPVRQRYEVVPEPPDTELIELLREPVEPARPRDPERVVPGVLTES